MSFINKIEEWMKEAEERPESAVTIVRLAARRLRELSERNEELLAENIALQNGTRVEEYQKRIRHLEYQLEMLKQKLGGDDLSLENLQVQASSSNLLIYNAQGRIFRVELSVGIREVGSLIGEVLHDHELPRLLAVPSNENLLLLFTSGRVEICAVENIAIAEQGGAWSWNQAALPNEPRTGEYLACVIPFSRLPLSDFFLQISRRGFTKKTLTSMSESILNNHYIGKGALHKSDQPFDLMLSRKNDRAVLVTYEGKIIAFDVEKLSYSTEERIKLSATDYVIASFLASADTSLLCVTQTGKVLQRESESFEVSKSVSAKGQSLIPPSRLEQGVRFMGAVGAKSSDQVAILNAAGKITICNIEEIAGRGAVESEGLILSIGLILSAGEKGRAV